MSEATTQSSEAISWQITPVENERISLNCPSCEYPYEYKASLFKENAAEENPELEKTEGFVIRGDSRMLAVMLGLIAFYFSHRAINGPDTPLNQGILIPVFIGFLVYGLTGFVVAGLWKMSGKSLPIYSLHCSSCGNTTFIASNGIHVALPATAPDVDEDESAEEDLPDTEGPEN
jgi:hypothetical protein